MVRLSLPDQRNEAEPHAGGEVWNEATAVMRFAARTFDLANNQPKKL